MASTTNGGNIWFGAAAITTGNDNNVISHCNIGPAGANLPTKAIYGNGSTTNTTTYNSGNQITSNDIYDYFNVAAASHGIYFAAGNTAWTISNNKFYQTATRTQTTGAIHAAIQIANSTGNDGHTISGNTIGYASAAGTGTYTVVFPVSTAAKFYGIYYSSAGTTATSSIQGNTITAINVSGGASGASTTAAFGAILIGSGGAFNIGNVTGNTIGSLTSPGAISYSSSSTSSSDVYGILFFPSYAVTMSNNSVGGITAANSSTGAIVVYGLRAYTTSSVTNTMQNNTIGAAAAPISVSASSTSSRLIGLYCQAGVSVVTGNTINSLTINSANVGTGASASLIGLWSDNTSATIGNNIAQNTIYALSNSHATAAVWVTGLHYNGPTSGTNLVARNLIYELATPSTSAAATANGIYVQAGTTTYQNNMIALGSAMTANSPQINGVNEAAGTDNFYFNSIYIGGSAVAAGTANSFAFNSIVTTNTRAFRDNIFYNARSNGAATGKHYAIQVGGTTPNPAGLTTNNNVLYAPGTGGFTGRFNASDQATLANWQSATGQDAASFAADPQYLAPAAATPNLHIDPSVATVVEGNGFLIAAVTDDFDGQTRSTLTPVDIGADAGNFIGIDLTPPAISYTPLGNTTIISNRAFNNVAITDVSGVNTAPGTKPRVYYKRTTDGNVWNDNTSGTDGWKYAEANGATSPFDFTIDYARLNGGTGVSVGDVVQYFVVAQDLAATPNVGINSGAFAAPPSSVALTAAAFPIGGTINSYLIATGFAGTYTVPGSYPSLTNAGGIFQALDAGVLTGNVVIEITADLAGELGTFALDQLPEEPAASNFTILIKPSGTPRIISGTSAASTGLINLNGADRVTIDGSLTALAEGTDQSLTITNLAPAGVVIWLRSTAAGNGATDNTVRNCLINGNSGTTTVAGILASGSGFGAVAEAPNSNNTIQHNVITKVQNAAYLRGGPTNLDQNWLVTGNTFGSTVAADKLGFRGMLIGNAQNFTVSQNTINGVTTSSTSTSSGVQVSFAVSGGLISRNKISDIKNTNTTGYGSNGIYLGASTTASNLTVANNFVFDVASYGYALTGPADNGYGIMVDAGGGYKIYFNSVLMATNQTSTSGIPAAINIGAGITTVGAIDLRNNIFANTQTLGTRYAIYSAAPATAYSAINYNDYYPGTGVTLGYLGSARATLAAWQTATGQDANSISADPLFVSTTDLHITGPASPVSNAATVIPGITIDIDGDTRSATTPDIGADEFLPLAVTLASFTALGGADRITVDWLTVSEYDNAGFNLYRADSEAGPQTLLAAIPSQGPGSTQGFAYSYEDLAVQPGQTWYYWLEAVSLSGATTLHGPVSATVQAPTAVTLTALHAQGSDPSLPSTVVVLVVLAALAVVAGRRRRVARR